MVPLFRNPCKTLQALFSQLYALSLAEEPDEEMSPGSSRPETQGLGRVAVQVLGFRGLGLGVQGFHDPEL